MAKDTRAGGPRGPRVNFLNILKDSVSIIRDFPVRATFLPFFYDTPHSYDKPPSGWAPRKLSRVFDCYIEKRQ